MARTDQPLVKAEHIVKHFPIRGGVFLRQVDSVKAVNDVSLEIREGGDIWPGGGIGLRQIDAWQRAAWT